MKNSFNDEYGEILLRKAAILLSEEDKKIYDKLRDDETIVNPNQEELDKQIFGMIKEYEKKEKREQKQRLIKKFTLRAAVLIAVIMVGFTVTFNTVEAFKITVLNFIMEQKEKFSLLSLSENNKPDVPTELNGKYFPHYLPGGYEIKNAFVTDMGVEISYINKNEEIINYSYFGIDVATGIDTENRKEISVSINGLNGSMFSKNEHRTLVFKSDDYIFIIEGDIAQEEIIKIAESIKK